MRCQVAQTARAAYAFLGTFENLNKLLSYVQPKGAYCYCLLTYKGNQIEDFKSIQSWASSMRLLAAHRLKKAFL